MGAYVPDRGHAIWLDFTPQTGHEQAGRKPAIVLSPSIYNKKSGLSIVCPITTRAKGYPFEVAIPGGLKLTGCILSDQIKSLDWRFRNAKFICKLPKAAVREALLRIHAPLSLNEP